MEALSLQLLLNGMTLGAGYGLLALGFALTLRAAGAINFAHGDVAVAAAYSAVSAGALGLPGVLALGFATIAGALFGLGVAGVAWAPLRRRPVEATFIAAIALGIIIQNGLTVAYGGAPQVPPTIAHDGWQVGGIFVSNYAAWTLALAAAAFGAVAFVLLRTQIGRRLRAAAEDPEIAAAHGLPVLRLALAAFVVAGALAGLGGVLLANQHYVVPTTGADYILKAYIAATAAGWGRILPTAAIAMAIALFETIGAALVSHPVAEGLLYAAFILLLAIRPQGLAGETTGRRA